LGGAPSYTGFSMPMEISHTEVAPGVVAIAITGKVTMGPSSEPIVHLVEDLLRQGARTIVFDLAGIATIDSTGIGRFISSFNKILAAGCDMRMAGASGQVLEAFHVSLLDTVFSFYENVDAAVKE
jgi:anti-anti-sigma factor